MTIKIISGNKKQFLDLLLLGDEQESMIDRYLEQGDLFALYDGDLKSVGVVVGIDNSTCELKNIATYEKYQGRGYATALINYLCDYYKHEYKTMILGTGEVPAILSFYKHCGFEPSHRIQNFFTDNYDHAMFEDGIQLVDMVYLKRDLSSNQVKYSFRSAKSDDAQTVKNIARQVITSNYTSFLGTEVVRNFIESGLSDKEIDDGMKHCTLMICDEKIIGFSITNDSLLHLIMIDTACQNKGYGSKLLTYIENILFDKYAKIHLQTFKENTTAVRFYLKNNWRITEETAVPELGKTMLLFEKVKDEIQFLVK